MEGILKKLQNLSESDFYPYHMPGHKRLGNEAFALDITEIDDFDNMYHADGIILEAQKRAASAYGAKESFFLVNGSTCGLLVAITAAFRRGDKVLVARNCHKAVYHAIELRGLEPVYLYPEVDDKYDISVGVTAKQVLDILEEHDSVSGSNEKEAGDLYRKDAGDRENTGQIKGMILTSPTYEGMVSEVEQIAELLHQRDMVLIVDEAHGAHFGFHEDFPTSAVRLGADLVIQSLHKTLPSMTQTALLHRCSERVELTRVQKYLGVYQTSSPSYVFMAYMDECISLLQNKGAELFEAFAGRLEHFYKRCEAFTCIKVHQPMRQNGVSDCEKKGKYVSDPGKVVICGGDFYSGKELYAILRERYHLQPEMCAGSYVLAIMTIFDTEEGFERLYKALAELDGELDAKCAKSGQDENGLTACKTKEKTLVSLLKERPVKKYNPWVMEDKTCEKIKLTETAGRISGEYIYLYPPGIPFIVPGEVISEEMTEAFVKLRKEGYELQGPADGACERIAVMSE